MGTPAYKGLAGAFKTSLEWDCNIIWVENREKVLQDGEISREGRPLWDVGRAGFIDQTLVQSHRAQPSETLVRWLPS